MNPISAALKLTESGAGFALVARAFIKDRLLSGQLVEVAPGKSPTGRIHELLPKNLFNMRPVARTVAAYLLQKANQTGPEYLIEAHGHC